MRLAFVLILLGGISASAQVPVAPYTENFDSGLPAGWVISNSSSEGVGWAVDGDPGIPLVGNGSGGSGTDGPTAGGSAGSLNYNDGIDFEEDISLGANKGTATSPLIDVSGLGGSIMVTFDLNMETDWYLSQDPTLDSFFVTVTDDFANVAFIDFGDNTTPAGFTYFMHSGPMGTFRRVGFDMVLQGLDPTTTTIQVNFNFTTGDDTNNAYNGIFVDNLQVCSDSLPPPAPVNVTPADGALVVGGPGIPVALDWTDSPDTTDCGLGAIWIYFVEVLDAGNVVVYSNVTDASQDSILAGLPAGTYHWHAAAIDGAVFFGPNSTDTFFTIEAALPPLPPDILFVNEPADGAQAGDPGFVNPVLDQQPVFSAVFRDPNTVDRAFGVRFQVSTDPAFLTLDFDSGPVAISPPTSKDERLADLRINVTLVRDTVYFWRIQCTDASGLTGGFSIPQSFRIGDDFEFGVRHGSSDHGRRCYVATAAFGTEAPEVASLRVFREQLAGSLSWGRLFSRWYATAGASLSSMATTHPSAMRTFLLPLGSLAGSPVAGAFLLLLTAGLLLAGVRRF